MIGPARAAAAAVLLVAVASCSPGDARSGQVQMAGRMDLGYPSGPGAWLADGSIVYPMHWTETSDSPDHLYRTRPGGGTGQEIVLGKVSSCDIPYPMDLRSLAGGALGAVLQCPQSGGSSTLVSIDPASGQVTPLGDLYDADDGIWSGNRGWLVYDDDGCESIAPADARGIGKMPRLLPWAPDADCTARGRIGYPQPSPTMDRLLVLASPEAAGVAPAARKSLPWHVYEVDAAAGQFRKVGGDFLQPAGLTVAGGTAVVADNTGLHTVNLSTGKTSLLAKGSFSAPAAAPDGRSIVVTEYPGGELPRIMIKTLIGG